ncbi:ferredoxin [Candidatus Sumerlaeota bacterium]|nr:ferredoxin [Candidatus Sumerlaeota bacterium]
MKAIVDADLCTGCGLCVDICPEVFVMESDVAVVTAEIVPRDAEESCRDAVQSCPVEAISIAD